MTILEVFNLSILSPSWLIQSFEKIIEPEAEFFLFLLQSFVLIPDILIFALKIDINSIHFVQYTGQLLQKIIISALHRYFKIILPFSQIIKFLF